MFSRVAIHVEKSKRYLIITSSISGKNINQNHMCCEMTGRHFVCRQPNRWVGRQNKVCPAFDDIVRHNFVLLLVENMVTRIIWPTSRENKTRAIILNRSPHLPHALFIRCELMSSPKFQKFHGTRKYSNVPVDN